MTSFLINPYWFGRPWTPADITTALWLDASDASTVTTVSGAVSQWNDKSGNARHLTQGTAANRPAYQATGLNGLPTLQFDGFNDFLANTSYSFGASAYTFYCVVQYSGGAGTLGQLFMASPSPSNTTLATELSILNAVSGYKTLSQKSSALIGASVGADVASLTGARIIGAGYDGTGTATTDHLISYDGSDLTVQISGSFGYASPEAGFSIGLRPIQGSVALNGLMSEAVFASSFLSISNRQRIEGYLAHKWGLAGNLPAGHPYKTSAPTIAVGMDGDAMAYIEAVETADGQSLETGVKDAIKALVGALKAGNLWTNAAQLLLPCGARTLAGALVPLKGAAPTNSGFVSGDYARKTGLSGNGSSKYLNSNILQNSLPGASHALAWYGSITENTGDKSVLGSYNGSAENTVLFLDSWASYVSGRAFRSGKYTAGQFPVLTSTASADCLIGSRTASNSATLYVDNTSATNTTSTAFAFEARALYWFALNSGGTPANYSSSRLAVGGIYSAALNATQATAYRAAAAAYISALAAAIP